MTVEGGDDGFREARKITVATLHQAGGSALPSRIRPVLPAVGIRARAFPVLAGSGDNLAVHRAIYAASRASVLVVACEGDPDVAYWGELMTRAAIARGLAGVVVDGGVRDVEAIRASAFPVYHRHVALSGARKAAAEEKRVGRPVRIGEVTVAAGDLVAADEDGVVVLPRERVDAILERAASIASREKELIRRIDRDERLVDLLEHGP